MFESNYNYVPNPYPPAPQPGPQPGYYPPPGPGPIAPPPIFIDPSLRIPGAAADAAVVGKLLASKLSLDKLEGSIKLINDKLELVGIVDAESGQVPSKGENGSLEWIDAARTSDVISIKDDLQNQINSITSDLATATSHINELFDENSDRKTEIADLNEAVDQLKELINGKDGQPGLSGRVDALETGVQNLTDQLSEKLDAAEFNNFLATVINGEDGLISRLTTLEGCCEEVKTALNNYDTILGGPENYDQPIYMTLNELKNMDIDGGDLDEEVEP